MGGRECSPPYTDPVPNGETQPLRFLLVLLAGAGAGALLTYVMVGGDSGSGRAHSAPAPSETVVMTRDATDDATVKELQDEIARLKSLLSEPSEAKPDPWPNDTLDRIEVVLQSAYTDASVDLLLEAILRLLRMGEAGYPRLRGMVVDFIKLKFVPTQSSFRPDQFYKLGRIALEEEKHIIGFINFLLTDRGTPDLMKPYAQIAAAYYIGSNAPGAEALQETLIAMVMEQKGMPAGVAGMGGLPKQMQVFAMAMTRDPRMIAPLRDELNSTKDKKQQGDILGALAYLGDPSVAPLIKDRLDPRQGEYRQELEALARLGTEEAQQVATEFLRAIPDSKRFYSHARRYVSAGGGVYGVSLIRERVRSDPGDPEIGNTIGALSRYPTKDSRDTLVLIRDSTRDAEIKKRAGEAAEEIDQRLRGEVPALTGAKTGG